MRDKDIHRLIQAQNKEENDALFERIQAELGLPPQRQTKSRRQFNVKIFTLAMSVAMAVVLCLAVVLPLTLHSNQPNENVSTRYTDGDLERELLVGNLKEYVDNHNLSILYLDWYDTAEEWLLIRYFDKDDNAKTAYLWEKIVYNGDGDELQYIVMQKNITIDIFDFDDNVFDNNFVINGVTINYSVNSQRAVFEYGDYKYIFEFLTEVDEQFIKDTIESLFN